MITSTSSGVIAVTVAARGIFESSAISPTKLARAERLHLLRPLRRTSTSPSTITKNSRPRSPSRISTLPSRRSSSSAICAIRCSSCFEQCSKSGASLEQLHLRVRAERHGVIHNGSPRRAQAAIPPGLDWGDAAGRAPPARRRASARPAPAPRRRGRRGRARGPRRRARQALDQDAAPSSRRSTSRSG